jgi:hypothetical protein
VPKNTLTNGVNYNVKFKTYDINGNESNYSQGVSFGVIQLQN